MIKIKVLNKHHGHKPDGDRRYYIGRGSPLGNPFPSPGPMYRNAVINKFEWWLKEMIKKNDPKVCAALNHIAERAQTGGIDLICYCKPLNCHGDVIKRVVTEALLDV
jgi:hypothetical protein